jgi:hypothetical protein
MSAAPDYPTAREITRQFGGKWDGKAGRAKCPVKTHKSDPTPLSISTGRNGQLLLHCFAGCSFEEITDAAGIDHRVTMPMSLDLYAHAKMLPVAFLQELGLRDDTCNGKPAVAIPYRDVDGKEVATRYRIGMHGKRFLWKKGTKTCLYGLDRLGSSTVAFLVEGESDAPTLWHHNFPAIGGQGCLGTAYHYT